MNSITPFHIYIDTPLTYHWGKKLASQTSNMLALVKQTHLQLSTSAHYEVGSVNDDTELHDSDALG